MARPTVEDLTRHARIPDRDEIRDSPDLQRYLNAAIALVEAPCGPLDDGTSRKVRLRGDALVLPFSGVESVTVTGPAGAATAVLVDEATSDLAAGVVRVRASTPGHYLVTVVREPDAADALWLAALIVAAHLWDLRRGATTARPGEEQDVVPVGYAVPPRAWALMAPWADLGVA